jgi:hypothetical protein
MGPARMLVWGLGFGVWGLGLKKIRGLGSGVRVVVVARRAGGKGERLAPLRFAARGLTARERVRVRETSMEMKRG